MDTNYYAENGYSLTESAIVNSINVVEGWREIVSFNSEQNSCVTDLNMSANQNGTFRIVLNGGVLEEIYYKAKDFIPMPRNLPFHIPMNISIKIEFKTEADDASASACIAGYLL